MKYRYRSRIGHNARTIPLYGHPYRGNGLDDGRWFRCWNCGFRCSKDRDSLGGPDSRDGITYEDFPVPTYGTGGATSYSGVARLGGSIGPSTVALELDAAGDAKEPDHEIKPVVSGGCPFCGSKNWRGDYP